MLPAADTPDPLGPRKRDQSGVSAAPSDVAA
jgi:hypothetical protein